MEHWILPYGYTGAATLYITVAVAAMVITAVSKGGFGGIGSLAVPMMMMVVPAEKSEWVVGLWLPLLIACDILTMRSFPKEYVLRPILLLAPWMATGFGIGYALLGKVSGQHIKLFVGTLAVLFVILEVVRAIQARRLSEHPEKPAWRPTLLSAAPFGLLAGVSSMIAHSAGPITGIYLLSQRLDRRTFVGTSTRFYFVFNTLKIPLYLKLTLVDGKDILTSEAVCKSLWLIALAPLFVWLGAWLNHRMSPAMFNRIIYVLLGISGVYLIAKNA